MKSQRSRSRLQAAVHKPARTKETLSVQRVEAIGNIQALRAVAALGVVYYHSPFHFLGFWSQFQGVSIFFVISGFIMALISQHTPEKFLLRRAVRIVPAYWLATIFMFFAAHLGLTNLPRVGPLLFNSPSLIPQWIAENNGLNDTVAVEAFVRSLLFMNGPSPTLGVGWTLQIEVVF